jgi:nitroimidazol reductase NimA-like FMN-containing flavoprotein (pyridoxamine 5'-phosphate oxidase superfamily)
MYRPVRRKDREIGIDEATKLMASSTYGVLATVSKDSQPYTTPLSYVFDGDCIYFHCAAEGQKIDNIKSNPTVSFCVVGQTKTLPNKFATEYESAIAFGIAKEIFDSEKEEALLKILEKYSPEFIAEGRKYIAGKIDETTVVKIDIKHLTGKARK